MIIDIDMGNTRIKWRIAGESNIFYLNSASEFPERWKALPKSSRFRVSSVLGVNQTRNFCDRLALHTDGVVEIAAVKSPTAGVSVAYQDVTSLGVDRWLGLLAAHARHPVADCVVIHAGTALVADFLRADGQHLGGYIVGGWQTSLRFLGEAAPALTPSAENLMGARRMHPGAATVECIEAGISLLFRGFFGELVCMASALLHSPAWLFAGGDAENMLKVYEGLEKGDLSQKYSSSDPKLVPGLVLDGLAVALP